MAPQHTDCLIDDKGHVKVHRPAHLALLAAETFCCYDSMAVIPQPVPSKQDQTHLAPVNRQVTTCAMARLRKQKATDPHTQLAHAQYKDNLQKHAHCKFAGSLQRLLQLSGLALCGLCSRCACNVAWPSAQQNMSRLCERTVHMWMPHMPASNNMSLHTKSRA